MSETSWMELTAVEIRVLGCLMEKQRTTPDVYPLTLNALRLACNQSTNRDPVVRYDEETVREALRRLQRHGLARFTGAQSSRSSKYRHLLEEALPMGADEHAVMCVLMLRGAQTPGELKQRSERMHPFEDLPALNETLERLIERNLVARLSRRPGQKEERYVELLGGDEPANVDEPVAAHQLHDAGLPPSREVSLASLEQRVAELERDVGRLRETLEARADPVAEAEVSNGDF
jgi:uncharacterized protein